MADATGGVSSPSTTISTGEPSPPEKSLSKTRNACLDSTSSGRVLTPENPSACRGREEAASRSTPAATTRLTTGRPMTVRVIRSQNRPCRSGCRRPSDAEPRSTRSPSSASTAGSRVSEAITATTTTRIAPSPMLRKMVLGSSSMPARATTTVRPLNNTARLAVAPPRSIASSLSPPAARSSR